MRYLALAAALVTTVAADAPSASASWGGPPPSDEAQAASIRRPLVESIGARGPRDAVREAVVPRKVHLKQSQVTVAIAQLAARYLDNEMGSERIRVLDGKRYSFCVEPHYHAPGSGLRPEGWHKGVTVYGFEE